MLPKVVAEAEMLVVDTVVVEMVEKLASAVPVI